MANVNRECSFALRWHTRVKTVKTKTKTLRVFSEVKKTGWLLSMGHLLAAS